MHCSCTCRQICPHIQKGSKIFVPVHICHFTNYTEVSSCRTDLISFSHSFSICAMDHFIMTVTIKENENDHQASLFHTFKVGQRSSLLPKVSHLSFVKKIKGF